jgi:hypothetical protein
VAVILICEGEAAAAHDLSDSIDGCFDVRSDGGEDAVDCEVGDWGEGIAFAHVADSRCWIEVRGGVGGMDADGDGLGGDSRG